MLGIYLHIYTYVYTVYFLELTLSQGLDFVGVEVKVVVDKVGHDF